MDYDDDCYQNDGPRAGSIDLPLKSKVANYQVDREVEERWIGSLQTRVNWYAATKNDAEQHGHGTYLASGSDDAKIVIWTLDTSSNGLDKFLILVRNCGIRR